MKCWLLCIAIAVTGLGCAGQGNVLYDFDDDGSLDADDCAPSDPLIHPAADDPYGDGIDQNCDGGDGIDSDGDGYPANDDLADPSLYDCDDNDSAVNPGAIELPGNGIDEDCDGSDELDSDADGSPDTADCAPEDPQLNHRDDDGDGYSTCDGDCDDSNADLSPRDADGDGVSLCEGDCDDEDPTNFPDNLELCDGADNDCDNSTDEGVTNTYYGDADGDGYGDPGAAIEDCFLPAGASPNNLDCDDEDPTNFPDNLELCDGADNDCDGELLPDEVDADFDGYSICEGDCDDANPLSNPADADFDGYSLCGPDGLASSGDEDCDDNDSNLFPGNWGEVSGDGVDSNCDGLDWFSVAAASASFVGESYNDLSGSSISSAGDVDGDGLDDLLIGAYEHLISTAAVGKSYLFFGSSLSSGGSFDLSTADASFLGESHGDKSGFSVSSAGDVDGDGLSDLLIGARGHNNGGGDFGKSYLFFGSTVLLGGNFDLSAADASFVGEAEDDRSGSSVSSAGDVDGDGLSDLLIGAYFNDDGAHGAGKSYLMFGATIASGGSFGLELADASFVGENGWDVSGSSVSSAGDVDGDGLSDLLIGAYGNAEGGSYAGKTYLFLGSSLSSGGSFDLSAADASFVGEAEDDRSGFSVSSAGDVDGDGLSDLLIGAYGHVEGGSISGKSYLFLGSSLSSGGSFDLSQADASFVGENSDDFSGSSVSSAGDVDGDGLSDLLIGAYGNDDGGIEAGKTYLLLSPYATSDYAGLWNVAPATSYACGPGFVSAQLDHLVIDHVAPYATVVGSPELTMDSSSRQPGLLEGGFVTSATSDSFALTRIESLDSGACTAAWSLTGSYTGPDTLSADFTATFTGSCGDCTNQSFPITGTR